MKSKILFALIALCSVVRVYALDRSLVERLPKSTNKSDLALYLKDVERSQEPFDFFASGNFLGFPQENDRPPYILKSTEMTLKNWRSGKCEEVQQKIKDARSLFSEFKKVASELAAILASETVGSDSPAKVDSLYLRMEELRKQILAVYPEVFDSWEISVGIKWEFPQSKIFVDKNLGPLFSLQAVATPHIQWQSTDAKKVIPSAISYRTKYPAELTIVVKTVPAEFCVSPFRLQAYGTVSGNKMNTIYVHLVTHRELQFQLF